MQFILVFQTMPKSQLKILLLFSVDMQRHQRGPKAVNSEKVTGDHPMSLLNIRLESGIKLEHFYSHDMVTAHQHTLVKPTLLVAAKAVNSKYPCRRYFRRYLVRTDVYDFFQQN